VSRDLRQAWVAGELIKFSATATDVAGANKTNAISTQMNRW